MRLLILAVGLWLAHRGLALLRPTVGVRPDSMAIRHDRLRRLQGRRDRRCPDEHALLAAALDEIGRQLRGGASLSDAICSGADRGPGLLVQISGQLEGGVALLDAIENAAAAAPAGSPPALVATALGFAHDCGGPAAELIDGLAASVRQRDRGQRELAALLAPVRASALLISLAPIGVASMVLALDRSVLSAAVHQPVTAVAMGAGLGLEGVGVWWMCRIADRVAPSSAGPS
jgi:tight adherence protein B